MKRVETMICSDAGCFIVERQTRSRFIIVVMSNNQGSNASRIDLLKKTESIKLENFATA